MKERTLLSWSGGMNSVLTLNAIQQGTNHEVVKLFTHAIRTENHIYVQSHGVPPELIQKQADSLGIPLYNDYHSNIPSFVKYRERIIPILKQFQAEDITTMAFGDLPMDDIGHARQTYLSAINLKGLYPLEDLSPIEFIKRFVALGFKGIVIAIDPRVIDESFLGKPINDTYIQNNIPDHVWKKRDSTDFHCFVYDGPGFRKPIPFRLGNTYYRDTYLFKEIFTD
jgi:diphthamide synthase (EF-2-diphthine--ammonia ligase)